MTPQRHERIKDIFVSVCARPPEQQTAALDELCGGQEDLKQEVLRLLAFRGEGTGALIEAAAPLLTMDGPTAPPADGSRPASHEPALARQADADADAEQREFPPGKVLGRRYRIVSRLGSGAMGEIYRADDLTLKQAVALKFMNRSLASSKTWLQRFYHEVRLARRITHANVCRVFDIGEVSGDHFFSMEYVDGENLGALLKRIGRLPPDKACDTGRQICNGLAAAHAQRVIHRDLKPANIMLDSRGHVRITDFGIAGLAEEISGLEVHAGTPAYMAPEQLAGKEVTIKSDLYALGLVLYELYTGKQAVQADTLAGYTEQHTKTTPPAPSTLVREIDPPAERIIMQCLEKDPRNRPASALAISAELTGSDLLSAAIDAGQTATPEMVAAASPARLRIGRPLGVFAVTLALLVAILLLRWQFPVPWESPNSKPPDVLAAQAQRLIQAAGYGAEAGDHAYGFCDADQAGLLDQGYGHWRRAGRQLAKEEPSQLIFWYRQAPASIVPWEARQLLVGNARISPANPPPAQMGSVAVALDTTGHLLLFSAVPVLDPTWDAGPAKSPAPGGSWPDFLREAGSPQDLQQKTADAVTAFESGTGTGIIHGDAAQIHSPESTVEVAGFCGRPTYFAIAQVAPPVPVPARLSKATRWAVASVTTQLLAVLFVLAALPWAWSNYRQGRADSQGAFRIAIFAFVLRLAAWVLRSSHTSDVQGEMMLLSAGVLGSLGSAALVWLFYIALEPHARRHWPQMLVTWQRILMLRLRDPLVGQHLMVGACVGAYWALLLAADRPLVRWLGWEPRPAIVTNKVLDYLLGGTVALAGCADLLYDALQRGLLFLILLTALRTLIRRPVLASWACILILAPMFTPFGAHDATAWLVIGLGGVAIGVWAMTRFGLVCLVVAGFSVSLLDQFPLGSVLRSWQSDLGLLAVLAVAAICLYGLAMARSPLRHTVTAQEPV